MEKWERIVFRQKYCGAGTENSQLPTIGKLPRVMLYKMSCINSLSNDEQPGHN